MTRALAQLLHPEDLAGGRLLDIPGKHVAVSGLPKPPAGGAIRRIDVIIRVDRDPAPAAD